MTDNITLNDGTTTRVYNSQGREIIDKNTRRHVRKTDERDATPETLTIRQETQGLVTRTHVEAAKTKVDATTGKTYVGRAYLGFTGDVAHFTQAEVESAYAELSALLAVTSMKADLALGKN